jgi:hypothetical protein
MKLSSCQSFFVVVKTVLMMEELFTHSEARRAISCHCGLFAIDLISFLQTLMWSSGTEIRRSAILSTKTHPNRWPLLQRADACA